MCRRRGSVRIVTQRPDGRSRWPRAAGVRATARAPCRPAEPAGRPGRSWRACARGERASPPCRHVQRVRAAIAGMAVALDEALGLELVDRRHHRAGVDPHRLAQRLLGDRSLGVENVQRTPQADVDGARARLDPLGEPLLGDAADLAEQEAGVAGQRGVYARRPRKLIAHRHTSSTGPWTSRIVSDTNHPHRTVLIERTSEFREPNRR